MTEHSSDRSMHSPPPMAASGGVLIADESPRAALQVEQAIAKALFARGEPAEPSGDGRLDRLLNIQQYERQRLGQELHDAAGQLLTSLQFSIAHLRDALERSEQESLVDEISGIVGQIDQEIRSLTFLQYPAELGEKGVVKAVQTLAIGFGRRTGIQTSFKAVGEEMPVAENVSLAVLRVAQEALTNVYRHSGASEAKVTIQQRPADLHLTVTDNGIGIPAEAAAARSGVGLASMRGRIELLGGRLTVRKRKVGTSISATVPLRSAPQAISAA